MFVYDTAAFINVFSPKIIIVIPNDTGLPLCCKHSPTFFSRNSSRDLYLTFEANSPYIEAIFILPENGN